MLSQILFGSTFQFTLYIFESFVFFAAGLLYLDSWQINKQKKVLLVRSLGFAFLTIVGVIKATSIQEPTLLLTEQLMKISGLVLILASLISEPILHSPKLGKSNFLDNRLGIIIPLTIPALSSSLIPLSALLMILISITYFRKKTEGLEKQLKGADIAFFFLGVSEALNIFNYWSNTSNVFWSKILAPYGIIWNLELFLTFIGAVVLFIWIWGYMRFRLQIQLFVMTVSLSLIFFLATTILFTFLLLRNLENDTLLQLRTNVKVIQYAIERQEAEALAIATAISENSDIKKAFIEGDQDALYNLTSNLLNNYKISTLVVTDNSGRVITRAENKENVGDSLIFDPTVVSALKGQKLATVVKFEGAIAPRIQIIGSVPLRNGTTTQGVISTGFWIDSAFVDGVKKITGLDVTVFADNKRAATTFIEPDGKTRFIASLENNPNVIDEVLNKGKIFIGTENILNRPYYSAYAPLKTYPDKPIGMLFVGKTQADLFETAQKSIRLTFFGSMILIGLSIIPSYIFSRFLKEQIEA